MFLPFAGSIWEADARLAPRLDGRVIDEVLAQIPAEWLPDGELGRYRSYLASRLEARPTWVGFADAARAEVQRGAVA
jgi:hypothetical protein